MVSYASSARTARRNLESAPRFSEGDWIRTARHPVPGHTRLPAYIRGARGYVHSRHGGWVYPDSNAHGKGERPSHLYTVRFEGAELWGAESEPGTSVYIDLFEPYLQPV